MRLRWWKHLRSPAHGVASWWSLFWLSDGYASEALNSMLECGCPSKFWPGAVRELVKEERDAS